MKLISKLALTAILSVGTLYGVEYKVDVDHSDIGFKIKHMMISSVKGNFEKFSGTFSFDEKTKQFSSIEGTVEVGSIMTQNQKRDNHLKSADFFNVGKYPEMKIKLIKQTGDNAEVELTIKGITKIIIMELDEINGPIKDPWGNIRSAFELHGKINRKDFNINFSQLLETGGLLVGDTVKLNLILEGTQIVKK
jgi:polyisoprenoid-binding protein YceI